LSKKTKKAILFVFLSAGLLFFFSVNAATLEMPLPGMPSQISDPGEYIRYIYIFSLSALGFLTVGAFVLGGVQYMLSGSVGGVDKAKKTITSAVMGLFLLLGSYLLFSIIDPSLVVLSPTELVEINIPEAPSPPDSGETAGEVNTGAGGLTGSTGIKCKSNSICNDINNGKISGTLVGKLTSLPVAVTVTETTGSHGCSSGDSCVSGAACGTSTHCSGRAVDIRTKDLTESQKQQVLSVLAKDSCTDQLFYSGYPEYCRAGGGKSASGSKSCSAHSDHIHYTVKSNCK
jgi:hypothetical protein